MSSTVRIPARPAIRRLAAPRGSTIRLLLALAGVPALAACGGHVTEEDKAVDLRTNAIDELNLNDIMLTVADPGDAVTYFRDALGREPDRVDLQRGYAYSLMRDKKYPEARLAFRTLVDSGAAENADRVEYALTLARLDQWDDVGAQLGALPSSYVSARQLLIEGMLSDSRGEWDRSDQYYEKARSMTTQPAPIYNNWGVSKMARGDMKGAEAAFEQAINYDPNMFSAKNNLAISYGLQKQYRLPLVSLSEEERAILLHNLAIIALRQGDKGVAVGLLTQAVETHPRYFAAAADKLKALEKVASN